LEDVARQLFEVSEDGTPGRPIGGLHESVLETDPTGREMRPKDAVFGNNLAVTLGAAVGALIVSAALFSQGFSSVLPLFGASFTQHLNEGIVLIASVTVAWGLLVGLRRVDVAA
jgi:hypothetical protein